MSKQNRRHNGDGCIIKRGQSFYLRVLNPATGKMTNRVLYLNGRKCTTVVEAELAARQETQERRKIEAIETKKEMLLQIAQQKQMIASLKNGFDDIWNTYLNSPTRPQNISDARLADEQRVVGHFIEWCESKGIRQISDISQDIIQGYLNGIELTLSTRSYNSYRGMLHTVFQHTYKPLGMDANPVVGISQRKVLTQSRKEFTPEQVQQIFNCFDTGFFYETIVGGPAPKDGTPPKPRTVQYCPEFLEEYRVVMLTAVFTGCRLMDACQMKWANVDFNDGTITYVPHKTAHSSGRNVRIPIHPMLLTALNEAKGWKDESGYVCPNIAMRYSSNKQGVSKTIQKLIQCATGLDMTVEKTEGRARGASQYGMHSFRHTFVSFCANAGVPLAVVADIVGHGNPAMTEHYFHASQAVKAQAVEAIQFQGLPAPSTEREQLLEWARTASEDKVRKVLEIVKLF